MKTFRGLIFEVAQPRSGDEKRFKGKHTIDFMGHPESEETQHTATIKGKAPKRLADYEKGEDAYVYEAELDDLGQEDDDIDNDGDVDDSDDYLHNRRKVVTKAVKEDLEEALATDYASYEEYVKANRAKGVQSIPKVLWTRLKTQKEEFEQIDEISKERMSRYADKASSQLDKDWEDTRAGKSGLSQNKVVNRFQGMYRANAKLRKGTVDPTESVELEENWSKGASNSNKSDVLAAIKYKKKASDFAARARAIKDPENSEHRRLMADHHSAMAKYVKHSYHANKWGYMEDAKKDHAYHIEKAKEYKSDMKEEFQLDEKAPKLKPDFIKTQREKDREHNAAMGRTATGRKKPVRNLSSTQKSLASMRNEETLEETYKQGSLTLNDGSKVSLKSQDATLLNQMLKDLNSTNRKKMEKVLMTDKAGFDEIIGFAREAL